MSDTDFKIDESELETDDDVDASSAPLLDHLVELRKRLIWCVISIFAFFALCFTFSTAIFNWLIVPYQVAAGTEEVRFIFSKLEGWFFTKVKIGLWGAVILSVPVLAYQIYGFAAPGLYKNERKAFLPYLFATPVLFCLGGAVIYYIVMPFVVAFFLGLEQRGAGQATIENLQDVGAYLSLIMTMIFAFGLMFQLPVVTSLLTRAGLLRSQTLVEKRKYAIVGIFAAGAIFTPPDPVSQIGLAIPTVLLYEFSIYLSRWIEKSMPEDEWNDPEDDWDDDDGQESASVRKPTYI